MHDAHDAASDGPSPNAVVFSCSGVSDKAALTDCAARVLHRQGIAKMVCMTGLAARQTMQMKVVAKASKILVLDGCGKRCAGRCVEAAGFSVHAAVAMHDLGFVKNDSPATPENVARVVDAALDALRRKEDGG